MKLKLAQRIAIGYYKTKFRALSVISPELAARSAFRLFCTPYSGKPRRKTPPVFENAESVGFALNEVRLQGWRWKPLQYRGKKVLIVHGFDSCSYRFEQYIAPLNHQGFEVVAFDAPGHGNSGGKTINALAYAQAILKAEAMFGEFYAIIAHSLGGLAAALAFEQLDRQGQRRLVLLAPTTETDTAIQNFFRMVQVPEKTKSAFQQVIEQVGKQPVRHFSVNRAIRNIHAPVLWIHDEEDRICPYADTLPVQERRQQNVEFYITRGLGHSGIYRHHTVFEKVMSFLREGWSE
ncbi:MAG TPA: alpha/beta fold hydrolase [Chitinophagaceae bacterium]